MASTNAKNTCAKCSKGGGTAMCYGCEQAFCTKHFIEHRQELSQQIDDIGQQHDILRRDLTNEQGTHPILARIDQWEQESITKIQVVAETARADLHQLLDRTKKDLETSVSKMTTELQSCRESDDYTEIDINKWMEQLKEIRKTLDNPMTINIECDDNTRSAIRLLKVSSQQATSSFSHASFMYENNNCHSQQLISSSREKFGEYFKGITVSESGLIATCLNNLVGSSCSGISLYASGTHHIRFRVEKVHNFSNVFVGIVTSSQNITKGIWRSPSAYGWSDVNCNVASGEEQRDEEKKTIQTGDEITLILDCDNRLIQLEHHRTNRIVHMNIDLRLCSFPWKIVVSLLNKDDCVRILR